MMDLGLARVQRETVQTRVYAALREKLMRGGFEPGQELGCHRHGEALA